MNERTIEFATFAAGRFWEVEATFREVDGVLDAVVGYAGGHLGSPTHEQVRDGTTGHAEAVQVHFDPSIVTYEELLEVFWDSHDPTTANRQGSDIGPQYRSAIFVHSPEQERVARESKSRVGRSGRFRRPVVTEIVAAASFHRAEEHHQQYLAKGGRAHGHR